MSLAESDIQRLVDEQRAFDQRLEALERREAPILITGLESAARLSIAISRFTKEIFGVEPSIVAESDPEVDQRSFVVYVAVGGEIKDILNRNDAWHRKLVEVARDAASVFQLSLEIADDAN